MQNTSLILEITEYQEANGVLELQEVINNGNAWRMEGSVGRAAMDSLKSGECYLPDKAFYMTERKTHRSFSPVGCKRPLKNKKKLTI